MLNWQWFLSDILGENSIKKRRSNSFQKAFERRLCFDRMAGVTGIFERISFLLQKSLFVFHGHRFSFCGIYFRGNFLMRHIFHATHIEYLLALWRKAIDCILENRLIFRVYNVRINRFFFFVTFCLDSICFAFIHRIRSLSLR